MRNVSLPGNSQGPGTNKRLRLYYVLSGAGLRLKKLEGTYSRGSVNGTVSSSAQL